MTKEQVAKVTEIAAESRATHLKEMQALDPATNPNVPAIVKFLNQPADGYF